MMDLKIFAETVEQKAIDQIHELLSIPVFSDCKVRIMPDVHAGAGCVIGFTANLGDRVIPNVVGVDIGCGMLTVPLGNIEIDFGRLDDVIRRKVPCGKNVHEDLPEQTFPIGTMHCRSALKNHDWLQKSMGTLGGGNHFIEIDADDEGNKYLIIHTGSRNLGKQVAEIYQKMAIENFSCGTEYDALREKIVSQLKARGKPELIGENLNRLVAIRKAVGDGPSLPKDLCYLEGEERKWYLEDMAMCQWFARLNRYTIALTIMTEMKWMDMHGPQEKDFETVHNYIDGGMVRKGAISAKTGERVLIPMNMRDGCIIGWGKGNEDWNCSAPHGAGRIMSRGQARSELKLEDFRKSMEGVYTSCVCMDTIDESPMAYKNADEIIRLIEPTVSVEKIIKPLYNFKAGE